jgi:acyl-CoA synthetase (AMP-forming)/AMP-acid ligase II
VTESLGIDDLWGLIEARADTTPDAVLAVDELDRTLTFGEYRDRCVSQADALEAFGIGSGTVVSWQLPTWLESLELVGALSRLGAVQNPILPICRAREVGFMVRQTGAQFLIVPGPDPWRGFDYVEMAASLTKDLGPEVLHVARGRESVWAIVPPLGATIAQTNVTTSLPDGVRWIFYTSGTTADPKGAMHTDATVAAAARGVNDAFETTPADRFAMVFPFTHVGGIQSLFGFLDVGSGSIWTETFEPHATVELLREHGVTIAAAGTAFWLAYLAVQRERPDVPIFPDLRLCGGGGSPKPPSLDAEVREEMGGLGVVNGYGLTECPSHCLNTVRDPAEKRAVTEGRPTPGVEMRITAPDGTVLPPETEGEIRVRARQLCLGYVDASLDADAFDADGFFRTGDLGWFDDDGYLVISGRLKDIIIRKGESISAKEVEDLLYEHPSVADVAVIGLPDPERGERACAVVVHAPDTPPFTMDAMAAWCVARGLMTQKIPEQLELVDVLPRNPSGKVVKYALRDRFAD